jgi:hypothetical protein
MILQRIIPVLFAALTVGCIAQAAVRDTTVLHADHVVPGDMLITGGRVTLEEGSRVEGSLIQLGGDLEANGEIHGDLLTSAGRVEFGDSALVQGNLRAASNASIQREQGHIQGTVSTELTSIGVLSAYLFRQYIRNCGLPTVLLGAILSLLFTRKHSSKHGEAALSLRKRGTSR